MGSRRHQYNRGLLHTTMKLFPIVGALISVCALVLLAIGAATNKWVVLSQGNNTFNPTVVNSKLAVQDKNLGVTSSTAEISYMASHYGLWIGCHKELKGAVSCAYIGASCFSDVCWIRKTAKSSTRTCLERRVAAVRNCVAYQVVRAFVVVGVFLAMIGTATQLVSLVTADRTLAMLAGVALFVGGIAVMTGFAVFYVEEVGKSRLLEFGRIGYSLILVIVGWPLALVAGMISCLAASMGLRHKEISDYSASNY